MGLGFYYFKTHLGKQSNQSKIVSNVNPTPPADYSPYPRTVAKIGVPEFPASPSAEETKSFLDKIKNLAKEAKIVQFTNCLPDIPIIKYKNGQDITFKNNDNQEITLDVSFITNLSIPANGEVTTKMEINQSFHFMSCQRSPKDYDSKALVIYLTE